MSLRSPSSVGARVRALREQKRLEQTDLAEAAGLSRAYISRLENGGILNPKVYDLGQVAKALGTTVQYLAEQPDTKPGDPSAGPLVEALGGILGENAGLVKRIVVEIAEWPPDQQEFVLRLLANQVFAWPGRPQQAVGSC